MSKDRLLEAKVALITGASRGIGLAIARSLAAMGAKLGLCARDPEGSSAWPPNLSATESRCWRFPRTFPARATSHRLCKRPNNRSAPSKSSSTTPGSDVFGPIQEASEANWDAVLDTNLKSVFLLSRAVAPGMIARRGGHIVNIVSLAGKNAFAGGSIYCASKWGLLGLTECMAEDLRPHGIRVSAVCPGSVATDFSLHGNKDPQKMLQPEDVAHAVAMILTQAPQSFISEVLLRPTQKP